MNPGIRTYHELDEVPSDLPDQIAAQNTRVEARLASVSRVVAVMSGKGGVGKSLISALFATALARRGERVGLLDADLNGPSAARLFGVEPATLVDGPDGLEPAVSASGVRLMSMALLLEPDRALIWKDAADAGFVWRGVQERGAVREFLSDVAWGRLDTLLVDLPPGTQRLMELHGLVPDLTGAVAVTIPSAASRDAVARSLDLAGRRGIPVDGVIENMSGARCGACGALGPLHAGSAGEDLAGRFGAPILARLPFDPELASAADGGTLDAWLAASGPDAAALMEVAGTLFGAGVERSR
ncbi:ATP-binding protein [Candidatus Palauibacter sp.]|uniref:Mrp/NBP35 family ATP-binding protein n=1 Tax=Candidatus Palauibacter sp. TaxID=3101350 RepID=UPI003B02C998